MLKIRVKREKMGDVEDTINSIMGRDAKKEIRVARWGELDIFEREKMFY